MREIRYAFRLLRRDPGYAAVAILTMALGIAATTTLFSVGYGVLLKPLPWPEADRIMRVIETRSGREARLPGTLTNGTYFEWRDRHETIDALGGYSVGVNAATAVRAGTTQPVRISVAAMTPSAFAVLQAAPLRGRTFSDVEVAPPDLAGVDTPRPVVISHALWREWFDGRDDALGAVIRLDDVPHTIVGVMRASFTFPRADVLAWTPMSIPPVIPVGTNARSMMIFGALARLKAGVSPHQAAAEATSRARQAPDTGNAAVAMFGSNAPADIAIVPMAQAATADVRPAILLLLAAVALLLATAVANVGSLQLARATTRRREIAVRSALGAARGHLVRQLFVESAVVTAVGACAGVALAATLARVLPSIVPADFPRAADVSIGVPVIAFTVLISFVASVGASLMPASVTRRLDITSVLADDGGGSVPGMWASHSGRLRGIVMAVQVAVASVLLVGAALLARSFVSLMHADRGYDPSNLLTARLDLPQRADGLTHVRIADAVVERMRGIPGVTHAAAGNALPFMSLGTPLGTQLPSPSNPAIKVQVHATIRMVSPGYIAAMRLPLLQGRLVDDSDGATSGAAVVNRSFAQQYLGDDPIGKHIPMALFNGGRTDWHVVGVVGDMRQGAMSDPPAPDVFVSYRQAVNGWRRASIFFVIRTTANPAAYIDALRAAVREQDPTVALDSIMTMEERVATSLAKPRLYAVVLTGFAIAALAIAAVGLFGVLSYSVAQRRREIGIRTALGAQERHIVVLVLKHAMITALAGAIVGLWSAYALTRYLSSFLYGVSPTDVFTYTVVPLMVVGVAAIACLVPARRAARIDPLIALRGD